jgi:hypothetical protein
MVRLVAGLLAATIMSRLQVTQITCGYGKCTSEGHASAGSPFYAFHFAARHGRRRYVHSTTALGACCESHGNRAHKTTPATTDYRALATGAPARGIQGSVSRDEASTVDQGRPIRHAALPDATSAASRAPRPSAQTDIVARSSDRPCGVRRRWRQCTPPYWMISAPPSTS